MALNIGNYGIKDLLLAMNTAFAGVSSNIFVTSRPKSSDKMQDFAVISAPAKLFNNLGYGSTICRISLYAKDIQGLYENTPKLDSMQNAVYAALPISNAHYSITNPTPIDGGSDGLGFHVWHIQMDVLIK